MWSLGQLLHGLRLITPCLFTSSGDCGGTGLCACSPRVGESGAFGKPADHKRQPAVQLQLCPGCAGQHSGWTGAQDASPPQPHR